MRLADFIFSHREPILEEWVAFARTCLPVANRMDLAALRDHASEMLEAIVADLNTTQSKLEQSDKSEGKSDAKPDSVAPDTAAQSHGAERAESGFDVEQMVAEYRALRASVIRLWVEKAGELALHDIEDLMRFNEAIDQALAESTARYTRNRNNSKEMFIAMLSHDLRTPLGAIITSAHAMASAKAGPETITKTASLILNSGQRMNALVDDLLDFTRSRLGDGIPIVRDDMDMETVCRQTVEELAALHPHRVLNFEASGVLQGMWDRARVSQALSNVIGNAVQHGAADSPINVMVRGEADEVALIVHNWGLVIPVSQLDKIFDPMHRVIAANSVAPSSNLGLGLYIAERIVDSHGGKIGVESSDEKGTIFTIRLPRRMRTDAAPGFVTVRGPERPCGP